jgi:hypothetical protein
MSEAIIKGIVLNLSEEIERVRVAAVGGLKTIIDEADADSDGRWVLTMTDAVEWIVAQTRGSKTVAIAARPKDTMELVFPEPVAVELLVEESDGPVALWIDPLRIEDFPDELLWVLRAHPGNVVDLHQLELELAAPATTLEIQRGRYRLSGGRFSISDEIINTNLKLVRVLEQKTGTISEANDGAFEVDILQSSHLLLTFAPPV